MVACLRGADNYLLRTTSACLLPPTTYYFCLLPTTYHHTHTLTLTLPLAPTHYSPQSRRPISIHLQAQIVQADDPDFSNSGASINVIA